MTSRRGQRGEQAVRLEHAETAPKRKPHRKLLEILRPLFHVIPAPLRAVGGMSVQYLLTSDPAVLTEYYALCNRVYRRHYPHLPEDFGREDSIDRQSHIVVGYDKRVVAGGRITISWPERPQSMPMEEGGFQLAAATPQFRLRWQPYAEFSRVAVDPLYSEGRHCSLGLIRTLARTAARFGVDIVFSICPTPQVRWNALNSRRCGVTFETFPDIEIRTPFHIPMTLCAYSGLLAADAPALGLTA